jgi:transketolase
MQSTVFELKMQTDPESLLRPDKFVPIFFDEAGHRVATQYLLSALNGKIPAAHLKNYRVGHAHLPGHPELGCTPGVEFSSGRLGHMWPMVNGVAMANPGKVAICLGSDGSQMEGNDSEAARLAVAQGLNVKVACLHTHTLRVIPPTTLR